MFKVRIGKDKLNPHQIAILLKVKSGVNKTVNLLKDMYAFGFESKSSFYTSISELREKGYIEIDDYGNIKLTEKGFEMVNRIPSLIQPRIESLVKYISFLLGETSSKHFKRISIAREIEDVDELEEYKKFLEEELEIVNKKLKGWRKIKIEEYKDKI
ncbi:MAG: hypothetical protein N3E39_04450 [Candidatus Methanomethylicia archaeon]|nr:hypothetical protein [Candidatus Methanomethylicia archaeon]